MKGLLYKDLFGSRQENVMMLIVTGTMTLFAILVGTPALTPCIGALMGLCVMAPSISIQLDKQSGWNRFICASPIPRDKVVLSLYLSALISNCFFVGLLLLINLRAGAFPYWLFPMLFALAMLLQSVTLPVGLKLGQTAVVIIFMAVVFSFSGGLAILGQWGVLTDGMVESFVRLLLQSPWLSAGLALLVSFLAYGLSFFITCRIYRKMEF